MVLNALKSFFWIVPFITFLSGYQLVRFLSHTETIEVPSIVGMHIHDAIRILSADRLNVRILDEKNDPDAQEGIIISQTPVKGQKVKPHQSIFLVLTRRPVKLKAPSFYGLSLEQARVQAAAKGMEIATFSLESSAPLGTCYAQSSSIGQELPQKKMVLYCSSGLKSQRIFPQMIGRTLEEVGSFLEKEGVPFSVVSSSGVEHIPSSSLIKDQRPIAASIVDLTKKITVTLTVE